MTAYRHQSMMLELKVRNSTSEGLSLTAMSYCSSAKSCGVPIVGITRLVSWVEAAGQCHTRFPDSKKPPSGTKTPPRLPSEGRGMA